ncbi:GGDEF domain-containing protein [Clostridium ihumii]|uniref:GGDEF domain-containing protein n=1 Tax=Clostridium ihumii TaxID=1470356 RepID=UPI0005544643|nr:diguanylate cyclase [Clostridium ihumii]
MDKLSRSIDLYIVAMIMQVFIIFGFLYFNLHDNTFLDFIMLGITAFIVLIAYFKGTIWGLLSATIAVFIYASYFLYLSLIQNINININVYLWVISIPIISFLTGRFGDKLREIQNENKELKNEMKELVTIDKKTGLSNLKGFYEDLEREISRCKRHKFPMALMLIKISYYNELLVYFGERKMREIIGEISECIVKSTRIEDIQYMLNDDTFAILLIETDELGGEVVNKRVKDDIKNINLKLDNQEKNINVEVKVGIVEYNENIHDAIELKKLAEKELEYDV